VATQRHVRPGFCTGACARRLGTPRARLGGRFVGGGTTPPPGTRYEAENGTISQGVVESNHTGYSGTGFVNYDNAVGGYVEFAVAAASPGNTALTFRFANGTTTNRPLDISVNGGAPVAVNFPGTGAWTAWQDGW